MKDKVYIVGGGASLKGFDFEVLKDKDTIAINKAVLDVPNANYFITMDYTFLKKLRDGINKVVSLDNTTKVFVLNFAGNSLKYLGGLVKDVKKNIVYDLRHFDLTIKSKKQKGLGDDFINFCHGNNSGYCAFQLAILLGYKKINLLGIDLNITNNYSHYHNLYPQNNERFENKLEEYYQNWKIGLEEAKKRKIKVTSNSKISRLNEFIRYKRGTKW